MQRLKSNSDGFVLEGLFVVIIILAIIFVGWHVWHASHDGSQNQPAASAQP